MSPLRTASNFGRRHRIAGLVAAVGIVATAGVTGVAMASTGTKNAPSSSSTKLGFKVPSSGSTSGTKTGKKSTGGKGSTGSTGSTGGTSSGDTSASSGACRPRPCGG